MMKAVKFTLLFAGLLSIFCVSIAQDKITYGYDTAGNRTSRTIDIPVQFRAAGEKEEATVYSEVLAELQIKIYPNPTTGWIRIEIENLPANETADIALYHLSGKLITAKRTASFTEMDITGQPAGTYLLKIVAGEEQTEWKIIKK
jgi:hypothetical protein